MGENCLLTSSASTGACSDSPTACSRTAIADLFRRDELVMINYVHTSDNIRTMPAEVFMQLGLLAYMPPVVYTPGSPA